MCVEVMRINKLGRESSLKLEEEYKYRGWGQRGHERYPACQLMSTMDREHTDSRKAS